MATPQLRFLSSQFVISGHPESPPKLYPMNGLMKPCALAVLAPAMKISSARTSVEAETLAVEDIVQSPLVLPPECKNGPRHVAAGESNIWQRAKGQGQRSKVARLRYKVLGEVYEPGAAPG